MPGSGYLTTHILDTARGCPAAGVPIELYRLEGDRRDLVGRAVSNSDGRTNEAILPKGYLTAGHYELVFAMGEYFSSVNEGAAFPFVDDIPIRFGVDDPNQHYHVPLLASPYSFSTYRGS